jgi:hypothetical protein
LVPRTIIIFIISCTHELLLCLIDEPDALPKGLIEEAATLAGMGKGSNNSKSGRYFPYSSLQSMLPLLLSNLHSTHQHSSSPGQPIDSSSLLNGNGKSHDVASKPEPIVNFSKTLNSASKSAQTISEDIDLLQVNIESLANNLGIDPAQFNGNLDAFSGHFQDNYSSMISSANLEDRAKLFALAGENNSSPKELSYSRDKQSPININSPQQPIPQGQFTFQSRQMPPSALKQESVYETSDGSTVSNKNGTTINNQHTQHRNPYPMLNMFNRPSQTSQNNVEIPPEIPSGETSYPNMMPMNVQESFAHTFAHDGDTTYYAPRGLSFSYDMNQPPRPQELVMNIQPPVNYYSNNGEPKNIGMTTSTIPLDTRSTYNTMTTYDESYPAFEDNRDVPS